MNTPFEAIVDPLPKVISDFVEACRASGDTFTAQHVMNDPVMLDAFQAAIKAGADLVTAKAERRIAELRKQIEEVVVERNQLRQVIRNLQGQVDDMRSGAYKDPEIVKLKAQYKHAQEALQSAVEQRRSLRVKISKLSSELHALRGKDEDLQMKVRAARREGFNKAVAAWQEALNVIKERDKL